jgi:hypothetical protein
MDHGLQLLCGGIRTGFLPEAESTLSASITAITEQARASSIRNETADKVVSTITSGFRTIFRTRTSQPFFRSCATSFGPVVRAYSSPSACVSPPRDVRRFRSSSSPSFRAASRTARETRIFWFFVFVGIGGSFGRAGRPASLEPAVPASSTKSPAVLAASGVVIVSLATLRVKLSNAYRFAQEAHRKSEGTAGKKE